MRMLIRKASASSNIIDTSIAELSEFEENLNHSDLSSVSPSKVKNTNMAATETTEANLCLSNTLSPSLTTHPHTSLLTTDASTSCTLTFDAAAQLAQLADASTSCCQILDKKQSADASVSCSYFGIEVNSSDEVCSAGLQSMFKGGTSLFSEQIYTFSQWFGQWSDCEQVVALYTLLRQLTANQARFIEHLLQEQASSDAAVDAIENQANKLDFVQSLDSIKYTKEELTQQLLIHFPLLHPGNHTVKDEYLRIIPKALSNSVECGTKVEDCRKLLTYTLIHPAVSHDERAQFTRWLNQLEKQYSMKITQTQMTHSNIQSLSNFAEQIRIDSDSTLPAPTAQIKSELASDLFADVDVSNRHLPVHATNSAPPFNSVVNGTRPSHCD
ncbi:smg [Bugula neritina]|uniref:Smg n=1 Tax=Bugula neritina TaxID=10212 RepID=A0A7J7KJ99_BUGNE|nr:smg [Bugula neritina]